jgi:hypothetical protein
MVVIGMSGMKNIRTSFRHTHSFGGKRWAVVETLKNGKASVRIAGSSVKMTNLNVVGTGISEGDVVYIEYSGIKPVVRPAGAIEDQVSLMIGTGGSLGESAEGLSSKPEDKGARVFNSSDTPVPYNTWTVVEYDTVDWDTDSLWTPAAPERLTAPSVGFYLIIFHWAWEYTNKKDYSEWGAIVGGSIDENLFQDWKPNKVRITHSNYGEIYVADDYKPFFDKMDTKDSLMFPAYFEGGDYIYAEVITRNVYGEARTLKGSATSLYPRLTMQFRSYE